MKKIVVGWLTLALAMGFAVSTRAQTASVQPSPEMTRLIKTNSGTWSTTLVFEPSKQLPHGGEGHGKQVWHAGPGGLSLIEDETASTPTGEWDGMSVTWWDPKARGFRAIWCDNHRAGCTVMKTLAHWEGNNFVLGDEWQRGGKTMRPVQ